MYKNPRFNDIINDQLTKDIWDYLNDPITQIKMETAITLIKPSVEVLQDELETSFNFLNLKVIDKKKFRRYKQLIGAMVRDILLNKGYIIDKQDVTVKTGNVFSRATRYKKI